MDVLLHEQGLITFAAGMMCGSVLHPLAKQGARAPRTITAAYEPSIGCMLLAKSNRPSSSVDLSKVASAPNSSA
jgi:hypothetical protein